MKPQVSYKVEEGGIYWVQFYFPSSICKVDSAFMQALENTLLEIEKKGEKEVRGLVFSNIQKKHFLEELDFQELAPLSPKKVEGKIKGYQKIFQKIAQWKVPTVSVIWGPCLGAGLELALACQYRWGAEDETIRFGLPEVSLGLLPCLGGIHRLSRLIGTDEALKLVLAGQRISVQEARKIGLVDFVAPRGILRQQALEWVQKLAQQDLVERKSPSFWHRSWLQKYLLKRRYAKQGEKKSAFSKALKTALQGQSLSMEKALSLDVKALGELFQNRESKNLISVNLSTSALRNHLSPSSFPISPKVAVVGAGNMGTEIASFLISHNVPVRLKDVNHQALGSSLKKISHRLREGGLDPWELQCKEAFLSPTTLYRGMKHAHAAIEAVIEDFEIKKRVLSEIEKATQPETIIGSTTSSFSISKLAKGTIHPERIAGLHFFFPLAQTQVVEVVRGEKTGDETIQQMVVFLKSLKKVPLVVKDSPGFLLGRVALPYLNEALLLLEEGILVEEIDGAMENFGMELGPLAFIDLLGMDTLYHLAGAVHQISSQFEPSGLIDKFYKNGRLGQKSGKGIYLYERNQRRVDPKIYDLIKDVRRERTKLKEDIIADRLLLPLIREAAQCLKEEITESPLKLEIGLILGLGFPPRRGGVLHYANERGLESVVKGFKQLKKNLGDRFEPGEILVNYYQKKKLFCF